MWSSTTAERQPLASRGRTCCLRRCLPSRPLRNYGFRGSIAHPTRSLCTLRSRRRRRPRNTRYRAPATAYPDRTFTGRITPALAWRTSNPARRANGEWIASSFALRATADAVVAPLLAMTGVTDLTFDQLHHRSRERFGFFLRKIMPRARDDAMGARTGEFRRGGSAVGRGGDAVAGAVQRDGGDGNGRQRRQPALQPGIVRIAGRQAEAMAIAVDHDIDIIRVVEGRRRAREGGVVEMPVRRPLLPQDPGDLAPVGRKTCPAALELKIILIPQRHLTLRLGRDHGPGDILNEIAVDRHQPRAAARPQRRTDAGGPSAPVIAGE